jgi:membrane protein required for colicin V production
VIAAVMVCGMTSLPQQAFWKNAMFSPAEAAAQTVMPWLPPSISSHVQF